MRNESKIALNSKVRTRGSSHPRRPRGSQSGRVKTRDERFQAWPEEPLGTDSHRTISKWSRECWFLIRHKECFVLLCPIEEQHILSSFQENKIAQIIFLGKSMMWQLDNGDCYVWVIYYLIITSSSTS